MPGGVEVEAIILTCLQRAQQQGRRSVLGRRVRDGGFLLYRNLNVFVGIEKPSWRKVDNTSDG